MVRIIGYVVSLRGECYRVKGVYGSIEKGATKILKSFSKIKTFADT